MQTTALRSAALAAVVSAAILSSPAEERRNVALSVATETPQARAWQVLTEESQNKSSTRRQAAVTALSTIKLSPKARKMAERALTDEDASVREAAAFALGQMGSKQAVAALRKALEDDSSLVRFEAAKALWSLGDHSGRSVLMNVLEGKTSPSDGTFHTGLEYANKKLHDPKGLAWIGVTRASSAFLGPFSLGLVAAEQFTKDKSAPARAVSASLLGADSDPESLRDLQDSLHDSNWVVRREAAKALGQRGCQSTISDLQQLLEDHNEAVKCMVAAAIINLGSQVASGKAHPTSAPPIPETVDRASTQ